MNLLKKSAKKTWSFIKRHKILVPIAIIILGALIYFLYPKPPKEIATQTVERDDFTQSVSVSGEVDSTEKVDLNFLAGGKVVYLGAKKGDLVTYGQTIAVLDQRTAQKNLENALITYSLQRNEFDQTQSDNQNRTPQQALNDTMKRILQNNQYDLNKAIVSVELQDLAKQQSVLTTPISGIVLSSDIPAVLMNTSLTDTVTIANPDKIAFLMDVDQADIAKVREGQNVEIILDAYPEKTFEFTVTKIDFSTHATSTGGNAYTVEADFAENSELNYRIGMEGNANIITAKASGSISVPISSIIDNKYVLVKNVGKYEKRKVSVGIQNDIDAVIDQGLKEGEKIVIDPTLVPQESIVK